MNLISRMSALPFAPVKSVAQQTIHSPTLAFGMAIRTEDSLALRKIRNGAKAPKPLSSKIQTAIDEVVAKSQKTPTEGVLQLMTDFILTLQEIMKAHDFKRQRLEPFMTNEKLHDKTNALRQVCEALQERITEPAAAQHIIKSLDGLYTGDGKTVHVPTMFYDKLWTLAGYGELPSATKQ